MPIYVNCDRGGQGMEEVIGWRVPIPVQYSPACVGIFKYIQSFKRIVLRNVPQNFSLSGTLLKFVSPT